MQLSGLVRILGKGVLCVRLGGVQRVSPMGGWDYHRPTICHPNAVIIKVRKSIAWVNIIDISSPKYRPTSRVSLLHWGHVTGVLSIILVMSLIVCLGHSLTCKYVKGMIGDLHFSYLGIRSPSTAQRVLNSQTDYSGMSYSLVLFILV